MTENHRDAGAAEIMATLALMQDQLSAVVEGNQRVEKLGRELLAALDTVKSGQRTIATVAARTHDAVLGNGAPLPAEIADDRLLEHYLLNRPADRTSTNRALVDWRKASKAAGSAELADLLAHQYRPSPTDTPEARLLRYQLAAIAREELRGRGATPPPPPPSTRAEDQSSDAARLRSAELARLWRAGEGTALFGEPELAGALDLFEAAERRGRGIPEKRLLAELAELHRALGDRLAAGERPSAAEERIHRHHSEQLAQIAPERVR